MNNRKNIIIIGGNAAGPAAAAKAKRVDPLSEVILIEQGGFISTGTCEMPYVLSGQIKSYEDIVFFDDQSFLKEKAVKVLLYHQVESIDRRNKLLLVDDLKNSIKKSIPYDRLIISTGSLPSKLNIFSDKFNNHFYFKRIEELIKLQQYIEVNKVRNVLIIGAGYIGLEVADALHKNGIRTTLLESASVPMPSAEQEISYLILDVLRRNQIRFVPDVRLRSNDIVHENDIIKGIQIPEGFIETDLVISAVGVRPNGILASECGLSMFESGAIKVNSKLCTSDKAIFACGDCIEVKDFQTGRNRFLPLASHAHNAGHIAGANAAGDNQDFPSVVRNAAAVFFDSTFSTVGMTLREANEYGYNAEYVYDIRPAIIKVMPDSSNVFGKLIFDKRTQKILGASFFGAPQAAQLCDIISSLIFSGMGVKSLKSINFNYTPPVSPFINILSTLSNKIR